MVQAAHKSCCPLLALASSPLPAFLVCVPSHQYTTKHRLVIIWPVIADSHRQLICISRGPRQPFILEVQFREAWSANWFKCLWFTLTLCTPSLDGVWQCLRAGPEMARFGLSRHFLSSAQRNIIWRGQSCNNKQFSCFLPSPTSPNVERLFCRFVPGIVTLLFCTTQW